MEDLASEFQEDFLEAVKVLEGFSSSDGDLREALKKVRGRVDSKSYSCAPKFWDDLRDSLGAIEQKRDEKNSKSKAKQVLKQIARLEVRFWAKESLGMLRVLDAASRLERLVDWIQTFEAGEASDQSSGPAVLYQVLNDIGIQKDMDPAQRDALTVAVRENLHKFPVSMQAMLERVGSLTGGSGGARILGDWRRRNQPAPQQPKPQSGGAPMLKFLSAQTAAPGTLGAGDFLPASAAGAPPAVGAAAAAEAAALAAHGGGAAGGGALGEALAPGAAAALQITDVDDGTPVDAAGHAPLPHAGAVAAAPADEEEDEAAAGGGAVFETLTAADVDPKVLDRAKRAVLAVLASNSGECRRQHVRTLLRQVGVAGLPIAALGEEIFFSGTDVFLLRPSAAAAAASRAAPPPPASKAPVPEELMQRMVELVRDEGGRLALSRLAELLQWQSGSPRHAAHGPLKKAVAQVPELFFEPQKVFTVENAKKMVAVLAGDEEEPQAAVDVAEQQAASAVPYCADVFAQLLATILAWLHQAEGVLDQSVVVPLIRHLGFKTRALISALSKEVYWAHPEAECEILLRSASGAAKHPKPLPDVYLHPQVHQNIVVHVKNMGAKAKLDKLSGRLGWNARSEMRRTYGALRVVLTGLREIFFDPQRLYLKRAMDGLVEWPVNREGRLGPQGGDEAPIMQHWTPAADDMKIAGDPEGLNAKRQILGVLMSMGGRCEVAVLRQVIAALPVRQGGQDADALTLEALFEAGGPRDLGNVLFWGRDCVRRRKQEAVDRLLLLGESQVATDVRAVLIDTVQAHGTATLEQLQKALAEAKLVPEAGQLEFLLDALPRVPELFFMPEVVFLRYVVDSFTVTEVPRPAEEPTDAAVTPAAAATAAAAAAAAGGGGGAEGGAAATAADAASEPPALLDTTAAGTAAETTAAVAAGAAAAPALLDAAASGAAPSETGAAGASAENASVPSDGAGGSNFFSFSDFAPTTALEAAEGSAVEVAELERAAKRARVEGGQAAPTASTSSASGRWAQDSPAWITEGAAVLVRVEGAGVAGDGGSERDAVLVQVRGDSCTVRVQPQQAGAAPVELDVETSRLIPAAPTVGATVRVVAGDRSGCQGKLVGLAGTAGVVEINKMSYETLPMSQLAVLASV